MLVRWEEATAEERAVLARRDPAAMARYLDDEWRVPPHVRLMADTIAKAVREGDGRIIIEMPPRHSKSETGSHWTPVWFLENWPDKRVVVTSYGKDKAVEWGESVRDTFLENKDLLFTSLASDLAAKATWKTTAKGGMRCVGVGGALTGFGFDLGICDDPSKDDLQAQSEVDREAKWQWWTKVFLTRAMPRATIILIGTRWHEDDLIGRVKRQQRELKAAGEDHDEWKVIRFPCIAEENDDLGREPGQSLWPGFGYDEKWASRQKSAVGPYAWSALYQQRPTPLGGGMFKDKDLRYWSRSEDGAFVLHHDHGDERVAPSVTWRGQTVDTAMKIQTVNDWTVVLTAAVTKKREVVLLDVVRQRIEVPDQFVLVQRLRRQWKPRWTAVEDKSSGTGLVQEARRRGVFLKPIKAETDKIHRATPASILTSQHAFFLPKGAPWLAEFVDELLMFPNAAYDDQVDAFAHFVNEIGGAAPQGVPARRPESRESSLTGMATGGAGR